MTVPARARRAIRLLAGRDVAQQLVAFIGGIVVARVLGPGPIGSYGIALFVIGLLALFGDLGMRTVLIRRAGGVSRRELGTCFLVHQGVVTVLVALLAAGAPMVAALYPKAHAELTWLLRLLAIELYLRAWRTICEVRLERAMRYQALAAADVLGTTCHHVAAVALLLAGLGTEALAWATLAGSVVRTVIVGRAAHWPPRLYFDAGIALRLARDGTLVQVNAVLRQAPHWINPTVVATLLGPEAVGLLVWASSLGRKPLEMLENAVRVSLPHFARVQHDRDETARVLTRYVTATLFAYGAWMALLVVSSRDLVALVYGEQWLPGLPALLLYAAGGLVLAVRWLAEMALIGLGSIGLMARINAVGTLLTVATSIMMVASVGVIGVPLGQLAGAVLATPWLLHALGSTTLVRTWRAGRPVMVAVAAAVIAGIAVAAMLPDHAALRGFTTAVVVCAVYAAVAWRAGPQWLRSAVAEELVGPWSLAMTRRSPHPSPAALDAMIQLREARSAYRAVGDPLEPPKG